MNTSMRSNAKALFFITWAALILLLANFAHAQQEVEFNYNGRVKHNGTPFDGTGYFKFALVNQNGLTSYWSNDSTSVAGSEPSGYITSQVIDGFFNVVIGDTLTGMDPLVPTVFNEDERIYLRVWFCHDLGSPFQRLNPDRRVVNPALLGQQSFDEDITLYVDAENGDDANNGLTTDTAKQTIQAAVDLLPDILKTNATINVLPGIYRESISIGEKLVAGDREILINGNVDAPDTVIISGADAAAPTNAIREYGIFIENQSNLTIQGIQFEYTTYAAIGIYERSTISVKNCKFEYNFLGIHVRWYSFANIQDVVMLNIHNKDSSYVDSMGVLVSDFSQGDIRIAQISNIGTGITSNYNSTVVVYKSDVTNCKYGYFAKVDSRLVSGFIDRNNTASNCGEGVRAIIKSLLYKTTGYMDYSGNDINQSAVTGSLIVE
ncbi:right-handed parallel beta-helix repeat-containing protein [Candidatus Sumerlaeota bacterium]|nr:right-handed parallel beta-helix repeat-containing protein [Candidatus Sumerlaeota bacterium]